MGSLEPRSTADLSVIVVSWNTRDLLAQCLDAIVADLAFSRAMLACHPLTYEILVVDNASTDGSAQMVRDRFPWVRLIANAENVGFARANNQAIRESHAACILLLNPDALVTRGAVPALVAFMQAHRDVGAAGPRLSNLDGSEQQSWDYFPRLRAELPLLRPRAGRAMSAAVSGRAKQPESLDVEWIRGACFMTRRDVVDAVGLLDEAFFMYAEEMDWCYRMRRCGYRVCHLPGLDVRHVEGAASRQVAARSFLAFHASRLHFYQKHYGGIRYGLYRLVVASKALWNLARGSASPMARGHPELGLPEVREHYRRLVAMCLDSRTRLAAAGERDRGP